MSELKITSSNIEELLNKGQTVLVDFYADWCGPCKMLAPVIAQIAEEHSDVIVGKLNIDEEMDLAQRFQVTNIPTVIIFKDGAEADRVVGFVPKDDIVSRL